MRPVKRGICIAQEYASWIYGAHRTSGLSENRVIVRLIEIGMEALRPFDDAGLRRVLRQPWEVAKRMPALSRQMMKRSRSALSDVAATRLTASEKAALRALAKKHRTTMSQFQRRVLAGLLAKEGSQ